jgi:hypothetical protein
MKLAEALILRADCQKRLAQLKQRIERNAKVQDGEQPSEKPGILLDELNKLLVEFTELVQKINKTNSHVSFDKKHSIADVLAERDSLAIKRNVLTALLEEASIKQDRYSRSEVKFLSTVDISQVQKQIDNISKQYRELDFRIQEKNWSVDLIE